MQTITFCDRCGGMATGWNWKYLKCRIFCSGTRLLSPQLLAYAAAAAILMAMFPTTMPDGVSEEPESVPVAVQPVPRPAVRVDDTEIAASDPAIDSIQEVLGRHSRVGPAQRSRISRAIVASARKHDVDPFLIVSILLVESSGDPFAISSHEAVGLMQIHVPTWRSLVEAERINLFRIEDNIDLGARILRQYTRQHGLWEGVRHYLGTNAPAEESAAYLNRVQGIYSDRLAD